jgi:hypothetical protein
LDHIVARKEHRITLIQHGGRSKWRWIEKVERELKGMGVKDWKMLILERDKWKKIVEEAKA